MYAFRTDVEKVDENIGCPVILILTLLIILPSSSGYIDCRISCRRCHENTEHPSVLEVYCAMCEECKQRRRERMQGRSTASRTTMGIVTPLVRMRDGTDDSSEGLVKSTTTAHQPPPPVVQYTAPHLQPQPPPPHAAPAAPRPAQRDAYEPALIGWPNGCPTPPTCSDSDEEREMSEKLYYPPPLPTTTTTTTTPVPTTACPPVPVCKKKKKSMMQMMPCMPCMPMCPCPMYTYPNVQNLMMPMTPTPPTTHIDYHYVYIGLPKNALTI